MGSKKSWRLIMIDINSSMSIKTDAGTIKGYMVCRAPKGETNPYYFAAGNMEAIYAYCGLPTANWPDLYEAEAFNQEYDLYLSCPPGSSSTYPSYFGGVYLTTTGISEFYNVTSVDSIDFTEKYDIPDNTVQFYYRKSSNDTGDGKDLYSTYDAALKGNKDTVAITISFTADVWKNLQEIGLNYWGDSRTNHADGMYYYTIDKTSHKLFCENSDGEAIEDQIAGVWYNIGTNYTVVIGGSSWLLSELGSNITEVLAGYGLTATSTNVSSNRKIPFLTMDSLFEYNSEDENTSIESLVIDGALTNSSGTAYTWNTFITAIKNGTISDVTWPIKTNNSTVVYNAGTLESMISVNSTVSGLVNIKDKCFAYINQKSATEKTTNVTISNIGYDKYKYDFATGIIYIDNIDDITPKMLNSIKYYNDDGIVAVTSKATVSTTTTDEIPVTLYKFDSSAYDSASDSQELEDYFYDVSEDYQTQSILIVEAYKVSGDTLVVNNSTGFEHKILYVYSDDAMYMEHSDDDTYSDYDYLLKEDINYNTITLSCTEEVYEGEQMSGGEFTGSLSETGKDSYGANIYWPNVLSDDDFSFIEVHPIHTLDEIDGAIDSDDGIYLGTRIIDDSLMYDLEGNSIPSTKTLKLSGQRYVTSLVKKNIKSGTTGCSWVDGFTSVVKAGWTEAFDDEYDDAYIFMDPTGQEFVHTMQASLAETHELAIYLSPKLVTQSTFTNPNKMTVTGRSKLCAQYAGEFKYYDSYTGKSFWMMPIGDVGLMCARIFENKLGGWAPAWYNYQGMGGQLPRSILAAHYNFSDSATKIMDTKGINPIIYNADDGLMVVSSKTTQDPSEGGDWEELGHVMSFVLCKREIRDNVMRPQIKKPIDDYWMNLRQTQIDAILEKRTTGSNKIWTSAICDIKGQNTSTTKAQKNFIIYVRVKVTPFSETATLKFENVDQSTVLS